MQIFTLILGNILYNSFPVLNQLFEFLKPVWTFLFFLLVQVTHTFYVSYYSLPFSSLAFRRRLFDVVLFNYWHYSERSERRMCSVHFYCSDYLQLSWESSASFKWAFGPNSKVVTCGIWSKFRRQICKRLRMGVFVCRLLNQ